MILIRESNTILLGMRATIFFLTFLVFIGAVVWRVDQVMFGDKLAWGEAQSRGQMAAINHALETEVQSLKDLLVLSYSEVELGRKDYSANRPYSHFQMMSKLLPPNPKDDRKDWQVVSTFFMENSNVQKWATPYLSLALKSVKESDLKGHSAHVYALMDPSRKPYLLVLTRGGANWYAGLLNTGVFQEMMDRQKGQKSTVFIVNLQGQTLGHTVSEYVGSLLTEDPLVSELIKSSVGSGFGSFKNLRGEMVQGLYEQIEGTNLYAVITTPVQALSANRASVRWQLLLMGAGLGLIGLAFFFFSDRNSRAAGMPTLAVAPMPTPSQAPAPGVVNSSQTNSSGDKMKAYTQVASSLSHELRSPLTSILGHVQLAMNQVTDAKSQNHLQKIETEARAAREIVQKLLIFAGEDKVSTSKVGLETILNKALKNVEGKLIFKGIKLSKQIDSVTPFPLAADLVGKAIDNVLQNAIEAMERAPKKELTVKLQAQGSQIHLSIADTGEGISSENLGKVFDPFFTTRSGSNHVGLGLSTALGIFKEAFGEMRIESEKGRGTSVEVHFSPQEMLVAPASVPAAAAAPVEISKPEPKLELRPEPKIEPAVVVETKPDIPVVPLLVDNTIERLIEDDVPDMPPAPEEFPNLNASASKLGFEEEPGAEISALVDKPNAAKMPKKTSPFTAKIDKPNLTVKKKASRLDDVAVSVRRPGERI